MEILQKKIPILSSTWLQSPSPNSSAPSAYSQGPAPNCWGSVQNDYDKHQPKTAPENTRPLHNLEFANLGGFGPKHIRLYPCKMNRCTRCPVLLVAAPLGRTDTRLPAPQDRNTNRAF